MLAGRYAETRIRGLTARVSVDRIDNTVAARPGAIQDLYIAGGTIPDRGYLHLRDLNTNALIGELDEEFVWEAAPGQAMAFAAQSWRIERITHNDVFVVPTGRTAQDAPFWKGEEWGRDAHFSQRIATFLQDANEVLDTPEFARRLQERHCLDATATDNLVAYLKAQRVFCGGELPHRHHVVVEQVAAGPGDVPGNQVVIHTHWGGTVNRPFALALAAAWEERFGGRPEIYPSSDAIYILMTGEVSAAELLSMVNSRELDGLLRKSLEGSGFFGARFRECAGRALLVTRQRMNQRMPLWVTRMRSKALLEAVWGSEDFPILLETWRTCLQDEFDMEVLHERLSELEAGIITWTEVHRDELSPFARVMTWRQINQYMYADDTPSGKSATGLRSDLLHEVVFSPGLRPTISPEVVERFVLKRQRLAAGYAPQAPRDLVDWVKERLLIPAGEWEMLLQAVERDSGESAEAMVRKVEDRLVQLRPERASGWLVAAAEDVRRLRTIWDADVWQRPVLGEGEADACPAHGSPDEERLTTVIGEWLRFYGPVSPTFVAETLGLTAKRLAPCLEDLCDSQTLIQGLLLHDGAANDICDSENFESLLRLARASAAPSFEPLPATDLALFLARRHGLCSRGESEDDLWAALEKLSGYQAAPEMWEEALLPARVPGYRTALLDVLMPEGQIVWTGGARHQLSFCLVEDLDLVRPHTPRAQDEELLELLPDPDVRYTMKSLLSRTDKSLEGLLGDLWEWVWDGVVTNDTMAVLRRGIANEFRPFVIPEPVEEPRRSRRYGSRRGRASVSMPTSLGAWFRLPASQEPAGLLEEEELARDRARLLLERHGLLFRELLQREAPPLRWAAVFRSLRLMELSGEVLGGCFFLGIPGLQFITPQALRELQHGLPRDAVWWVNACDPASLCGIGLPMLKDGLPRRVPGNLVSYVGADPALIVQRSGHDLRFMIEPDDPRLAECLAPLQNLLRRDFQPLSRIVVETINGAAAAESAYKEALSTQFEVVRDVDHLVLLGR